jgi:hypothetical protein
MSMFGVAAPISFIERNWLWLLLAAPVAAYAAWISAVVVPEIVRVVVPEVTRSVLGG